VVWYLCGKQPLPLRISDTYCRRMGTGAADLVFQ
jgi:hypothetical protein